MIWGSWAAAKQGRTTPKPLEIPNQTLPLTNNTWRWTVGRYFLSLLWTHTHTPGYFCQRKFNFLSHPMYRNNQLISTAPPSNRIKSGFQHKVTWPPFMSSRWQSQFILTYCNIRSDHSWTPDLNCKHCSYYMLESRLFFYNLLYILVFICLYILVHVTSKVYSDSL